MNRLPWHGRELPEKHVAASKRPGLPPAWEGPLISLDQLFNSLRLSVPGLLWVRQSNPWTAGYEKMTP